MKVYDHVNVINSVNQRECYIRHGLHLNSLGKELMAQKIINLIKNLHSASNTLFIPLSWKEEGLVDYKDNSTTQYNPTTSRTSGRKRKQPTTRGDDFLWTGDIPSKMYD